MGPALFGDFETDPSLPVFKPERPRREMIYFALGCPCGADVFRVTGWPRIISGRGGFFWRSVARVWREAQLPVRDEELIVSPLWLPIFVRCPRCNREEALLDHERVLARMPLDERTAPKESVRCRVCRRSRVELVAGVEADAGEIEDRDSPCGVEIVSRCHSCHRQARIAWSGQGRSEQQIKLDLLYGRR